VSALVAPTPATAARAAAVPAGGVATPVHPIRSRASVYAGLTPLTAEDVAEAITWVVTRPPHFTVARIDLLPRDQASTRDMHRAH
jgi:NADP-dependent 3-hydroxy acid dehydrogenase YdfG